MAMSGRDRGLWPFAAVGLIAVVTVTGLIVVWLSPQRADLEGFGGLAISAAGIAAGWIAWIWRRKGSQGYPPRMPGSRGNHRPATTCRPLNMRYGASPRG